MFLNTLRTTILFTCLFGFLSSFAGGIKGKVIDTRTGEPLPGATVQIENGNFKRVTSVNLDGTYAFKNIPDGTYTLTIKFVGYAPVKQPSVTVASGQTTMAENVVMKEESKELEMVQVLAGRKESDHSARRLEQRADIVQNV